MAENNAIYLSCLREKWQATGKYAYAIISLLEDERLTTRVDDEAAAVLIEWGRFGVQNVIRRAQFITVSDRDGMLEVGLKSIKRLMRAAGRFVCLDEPISEGEVDKLINIIALSRNQMLGRPLQIPTGDLFLDIVQSDEWKQLSQADRLILLRNLLIPVNVGHRSP